MPSPALSGKPCTPDYSAHWLRLTPSTQTSPMAGEINLRGARFDGVPYFATQAKLAALSILPAPGIAPPTG